MKKLLLAVLLIGSAALGGAPTAGAQALDTVTGDAVLGDDPFRNIYVNIDARATATGDDPSGRVGISLCSEYTEGCGTAYSSQGGAVTCMYVRNSRAIIGYYGGAYYGSGYPTRFRGFVEVVDNVAGPDTLNHAWSPVEIWINPAPTPNPLDVPITDCPTTLPNTGGLFAGPLSTPGPFPQVLQDFAVTDARATPRSKDQCRAGGWQTLGFQNHGQCVRAVVQFARLECRFIRAAHGHQDFRAWYGAGNDGRHAMRRCVRERSQS